MNDMNDDYQTALKQLDELMVHFRSKGKASCEIAEQEDMLLIRLDTLKYLLKPTDTKAINDIRNYYNKHINHAESD
ncbi:TPA: branched-chain amino acid ABC transporter [Neisseria weaveri]|uniref:Branched-chain amino acid ABC transporter n=2 Tax=Neisseria weaveri TaxID=28091 RepID=A0A448VQF4_9NEIS|nr:branched-chain amino acid ABC transporter [Neisseria weaveri]SAY50624.1 Uncharacterised protein [Neisseria weaveri]VEJ52036.1 Uncharacterised protein [Neisseria weaveri]